MAQIQRQRALATVAAGYTVFIDYTATGVPTAERCEGRRSERESDDAAMKELNVVTYTAD